MGFQGRREEKGWTAGQKTAFENGREKKIKPGELEHIYVQKREQIKELWKNCRTCLMQQEKMQYGLLRKIIGGDGNLPHLERKSVADDEEKR